MKKTIMFLMALGFAVTLVQADCGSCKKKSEGKEKDKSESKEEGAKKEQKKE